MLTLIYAIIVSLRNKWFDRNRPDSAGYCLPIISIGNVSTGGTGKTPFVIYLCELLKGLGYSPIIIGRGYGRKSKNDTMVSDDNTVIANVSEAGDEMLLVAQKAKVTVFAGKSKSKLAKKISEKYKSDNEKKTVIIVDDGFQHRKLYRNLDIVLVDKKTLNTVLLPLGRLREPLNSLQRADVIALTKGATRSLLQAKYAGKQLIFEVSQNFDSPYFLTATSVNPKQAKEIVVLSGIANPTTFSNMLTNQNYEIIKHIKKSDHFYYTTKDIENVCRECASINCYCIATTEKDAVKLNNFSNIFKQYGIGVLVFPITMRITNEEKFIAIIKEKLQVAI